MKKLFLTFAAVLAFGAANAQETKFGAKAGLNNSNFTGDFDTDARTSFYLGGFADIAVSDKFHVQPELLYSMEGASDTEADLSFIRIPIMAKYMLADKFSLQAGPSLGFVAGGGAVKDSLKSMDIALGVGAGYDITDNIFVDARYNLGLSNISDIDGADAKTTCIQLGVGYKF